MNGRRSHAKGDGCECATTRHCLSITSRLDCARSSGRSPTAASHPPLCAEAVKWLQAVQALLRLIHLPTEHLALDPVLGEVDDREAVLFERIQSGVHLDTGWRFRRRATPRRWPRFGTCADRPGQNRHDGIAPEVEIAVTQNPPLGERMQIAAQK